MDDTDTTTMKRLLVLTPIAGQAGAGSGALRHQKLIIERVLMSRDRQMRHSSPSVSPRAFEQASLVSPRTMNHKFSKSTATSSPKAIPTETEVSSLAPLPGIEVVPVDLQPLFLEMQQFGMSSSVQLKSVSPEAARELYKKASLRLDSLPTKVCLTSTGESIQLPLPGKRGVEGWRVDHAGNVGSNIENGTTNSLISDRLKYFRFHALLMTNKHGCIYRWFGAPTFRAIWQ